MRSDGQRSKAPTRGRRGTRLGLGPVIATRTASRARRHNGRHFENSNNGDLTPLEDEPEDEPEEESEESDASRGSINPLNQQNSPSDRKFKREGERKEKIITKLPDRDPEGETSVIKSESKTSSDGRNQRDYNKASKPAPFIHTKQQALANPQLTISADISHGSDFQRRILTALRPIPDKEIQPPVNTQIGASYPEQGSVKDRARDLPITERHIRIGGQEAKDKPEKDKNSWNLHRFPIGIPSSNNIIMENIYDSDSNDVDQDRSVNDALRIIRENLDIQDESRITMETLRRCIREIKVAIPKVQIIHRVTTGQRDQSLYLDTPQWSAGETSSKETLVGNLPIRNISSYLSKHPEISCTIYRDYDVSHTDSADSGGEDLDTEEQPKHSSEAINLVSRDLRAAIEAFIEAFCGHFKIDAKEAVITKASVLSSPYLPIFHFRGSALDRFSETLNNAQQEHFQLLLNYILSTYEAEYSLVDNMTRERLIADKYIKYLFKPGDVVVQGSHQGSRGYLCTTWLERRRKGKIRDYYLNVRCWNFDGVFSRQPSELALQVDTEDPSEKAIDSIDIRPLAYVNDSTRERLKRRGSWFWKFRARHMVSYQEENELGFQDNGPGRYMIDMKMYRELHRPEEGPISSESRDDLGPEALKRSDPPDNNFIYLAPLTIKGYNLKRKKWLDLELDKIEPVIWNKQAFKHLVIKEKTKKLIQALISNQIEAEKSTDLITGKGNGLIMLLHGGPGTGKTLTAESIAEIAERPLYPVTCGDIGTEPEDVENYLESVLHIGKTWGCVVLLDEADVFLEQRSLEDLRRNALVSVFLRVLEYYDGILILTSNRVGTFDEAFKSRIQLALHYKNLSEHQRTQIWGNFISRLEDINEEGIDFADLKDNIEELAKRKLNGREIRNVITIARQYARWERQQPNNQHHKLDYKVMKEVIETAGEFDQYIEKLNRGHTYDQLAEEDGLRWGGSA
ncbi:hypothetical protein F4803DRAFT_536888 [Xylaria telfairii]|nr:hypothetical protein F4803DRAFT_536888 [Xylaria telfairii]